MAEGGLKPRLKRSADVHNSQATFVPQKPAKAEAEDGQLANVRSQPRSHPFLWERSLGRLLAGLLKAPPLHRQPRPGHIVKLDKNKSGR
jgi:hypothetical protein